MGILKTVSVCCAIFLVSMVAAFSSDFSPNPAWKDKGYSAIMYDNTNGLPTSEANAIVETEEGFIWIGSYSGLIRYDGRTFERINSAETGIANVVSLFADSKNRLWIGTNDSGAVVLENNTFRSYSKKDGLPSLSIRAITEDNDGTIYLATTRGIAIVDSQKNLTVLDEPKIKEETILCLQASADSTIYGTTRTGMVFTIRNKKLAESYSSNEHDVVTMYSIFPDPNAPGNVYIGTTGSELYYGRLKDGLQAMKKISAAPLYHINAIANVNGMIWINSDRGIGVLQDNTVVPLQDIPMTTSVEKMMVDYQGNLWFASSQQGVMKIVPNFFADIFKLHGIESEVVYTTCIQGEKLFIGTKGKGLIVLEGQTLKDSIPILHARTATGTELNENDLLTMLSNCRIRSIIKDSKDRLWFSTYSNNALVQYDRGIVTVFSQAEGLPSNRVRAVCERTDGSFMVCCTGGLAIIKDNTVTSIYGESSHIGNTEILTAAQMNSGDMVVGTDGGGIYIIGTDGTVSHIGSEQGLSSDVILRIKKDISKELLWIITSNSIAYMTEDLAITTIKNFPYSNNFDIYQNSKGDVWILSSNGIYEVPVAQLLQNKEITPLHYGIHDGLSCIATANSYSALAPDGNLYMAGSTGIAKVNIEQTTEEFSTLKMTVPFIAADGTFINPDESGRFIISPSVKKLTIYSHVFNYSLLNPQVKYCLCGFETVATVIKSSDITPIHYTNLKGGEYHFVMQLQTSQGQIIKSIDIPIIKQPAVWESVLVRSVCMLVIAALVLSIVKIYIDYRTHSFLKKEQAQKQLIREIVEAFAKIIDMKDKYTNGHSFRVAEYTAMLAKELGYDEDTVSKYYNIALLHDIGKIGIPPEILNKPKRLTKDEFKIIKAHTELGYEALKDISIMPELAIGAVAHHERPDGKGYPKGLKGNEIPRVAQIIAVADTFDAMYSDRPYRKRISLSRALSIMKKASGTQLSSDVVSAFLRLVDKGEFKINQAK
ncbi:MAG: HD domain-containing protein [Treponema sp.]|nr:HD domain-containing protein [Treponema sp.]